MSQRYPVIAVKQCRGYDEPGHRQLDLKPGESDSIGEALKVAWVDDLKIAKLASAEAIEEAQEAAALVKLQIVAEARENSVNELTERLKVAKDEFFAAKKTLAEATRKPQKPAAGKAAKPGK